MATDRKHNAISHGAYARDVVLPWEDPKEFKAFHESFRQDLDPSGALQEDAVLELADLHWRLRRLRQGCMLPFYKAPVSPELMKANKQGAKGLATYLTGPRKPTKLSQLGDAMLTAALDGRNSDLETLKRRFDAAPPNPISDDLIALAYEPTRMEE